MDYDSEKTRSELIEENKRLKRDNETLRTYYTKLVDIVDRFETEVMDLYESLGTR